MKIHFQARGDDGYQLRLLSSLQSQIPLKIKSFTPIRKEVYLVTTDSFPFILKGFSNKTRLELQESLTASLKKEGFLNTYEFYDLTEGKSLYFNKKLYGTIEYLEPAAIPFTYSNEMDRSEGLDLLCQFHDSTKTIVEDFSNLVVKFNLLDKWRERLSIFIRNIPVMKMYLDPKLIKELVEWSKLSLSGIEKYGVSPKEPKVILHGDVAHHNFLREKTGRLSLIDYDLISIGPPSMDLIQYSNRILPFLDWSFEQLASYKPLEKYLDDPGFLFALMFPTDILREWNRLVRERAYYNINRISLVNDLTFSKLSLRKQFINELKNVVK